MSAESDHRLVCGFGEAASAGWQRGGVRLVWILPAGLALGVLSRVEEVAAGFSAGISSNATWLAAAFLAGVAVRSAARAAAAGAAALTAANAAYYAWIAATEPGLALDPVAGPPERWLAVGVAGGAVFGFAGRVWAAGPPLARVGAALLLGGVLVAEGISAVTGGPATDATALVLGLALPVASARGTVRRIGALAATLVIAAVATTGALEALMP